jgi:predicted DNA-binding transcriptional regulator AlpA
MNTNEIVTKQDLYLLHEKIDYLIETVEKLKFPSQNNKHEVYLTSKEVMDTYKISKSHLSDLRIEGKIPYSNPFGVILYPKSEIEELIRKGRL